MDRYLVAVGGGSLKEKSTLEIDRKIAELARRGEEKRGLALFLPTASYDSLPYFNTFRKTYTSECGMKCDVALFTKKDVPLEKNLAKIEAADLIYLGGGNTLHLIEVLRSLGVVEALLDAYRRGAVLAGLSAGAICWFETMYSDADPNPEPYARDVEPSYAIRTGLGVLKGAMTPHFNHREEFAGLVREGGYTPAYAVEDNAALLFVNETIAGVWSAGGHAFEIDAKRGERREIPPVSEKKV